MRKGRGVLIGVVLGDGNFHGQSEGFGAGAAVKRVHRGQLHHQEERPQKGCCRFWDPSRSVNPSISSSHSPSLILHEF